MSSADPRRTSQPGGPPVKTAGLRERKKQKTREAIQRAAMRLFQKQGYDETTIEEIAAAVEISPSTFFNYFPTKEDVVLYDAYDPMTISMFLAGPKDEPLNVGIRRVVEGMAATFEADAQELLARTRLITEVPELRARIWDEVERTQVMLATLLAKRSGRRRDDFEVQVIARVVTAAMLQAGLQWLRTNGRDRFADLINRALDIVESGAILRAHSAGKGRRRRQ